MRSRLRLVAIAGPCLAALIALTEWGLYGSRHLWTAVAMFFLSFYLSLVLYRRSNGAEASLAYVRVGAGNLAPGEDPLDGFCIVLALAVDAWWVFLVLFPEGI